MGLFDSLKEKGLSKINNIKQSINEKASSEINAVKQTITDKVNSINIFNLQKNGEKQPTKEAARTLKKEDFEVAGTYYYMDNINKLATCNPDWKSTCKTLENKGLARKKIYRYTYVNKPVKLIEEPKNPNDKNAVKVIIAGEHVGYISREDNKHVKEILKKGEIKYISAFFSGGQYKIVTSDHKIEKDEDVLWIRIRIAYI